jgi:O-antigen/teichoic acid export membrane protein
MFRRQEPRQYGLGARAGAGQGGRVAGDTGRMTILDKLRAFMPKRGHLSGRSAKAGLWSMAELGSSYALRLGSNLIMTRLVLPEAFGLMAMVTLVHVALMLMSDLGVEQNVVRSERGDEPHFLRVAWTVQLVRCSVLALLVIGAAGLLALVAPHLAPAGTVYADPDLPALIAVSALVLVFTGLESTNKFLAARRLQLHWNALVAVVSQVIGLIAMVAIAWISPSVWSLLAGMMVGSATRALLSHLMLPGPSMRLTWDREIAREMWHFGKWIIGASGIGLVAQNADRVFLGAVLSKEAFGFYVIAVLWVSAATGIVTRINNQIALPLFSAVARDRPWDATRVYERYSRISFGVAITLFLLLVFGSGLLIRLLYPDSYLPAASYMPFLALGALVERFEPLSILLLSRGNTRILALQSLVGALAVVIGLVIGYNLFGIEGALVATVLSPLIAMLPIIAQARDTLGRSPRPELLALAAILAAFVAVVAVLDPLPG